MTPSKIKYLLITLMLSIASATTHAQMAVSGFELDLRDQTANNESTKVIDDNNEVCALIKVQTTQKGFAFEGGTVGIAKVEENHVAEIWVFVPAGLRRITILHPQLGSLRDYFFPETLQPGRTYIMTLVCGTAETVVNQKSTSQYFVLSCEPANALVEIDGVIVEGDNGVIRKKLSMGKHDYRVSAKDYHTEVGKVTIEGEKVSLSVKLKPAFGWIEIKGPTGASVYINNDKVGEVPMKSQQLASGKYDLKVLKDLYLPFREQVLVSDNAVTTVEPRLVANYSTVRLAVANDAEIWVNDEKRGNGSVTLDLEPGEYTFETRKQNHRSQSIVREITLTSGGAIDLPAPVAVCGSLEVDVTPVGAKVSLDGKSIGESPLLLDKVLVGNHEVVISHPGCAERRESIQIVEEQTLTINGGLSQGREVRLTCGVPTARWTIDGVERGNGAELTVELSYAEHSVNLKADDYKDFSANFTVGTNTVSKSFDFSRCHKDANDLKNINGIILGVTTRQQAKKMGWKVKKYRPTDKDYFCEVGGGIDVWDHDGIRIWTSCFVSRYDELPASWANSGFDFKLSYAEWKELVTSLGFNWKMTSDPKVQNSQGKSFVIAEVTATREDCEIRFSFILNDESYIYQIYLSPSPLYSITMKVTK